MTKFYTVEEVAEILSVHWQTVHALIKRGELKAIKVGKRYRISDEDLKKYIESKTVVVK